MVNKWYFTKKDTNYAKQKLNSGVSHGHTNLRFHGQNNHIARFNNLFNKMQMANQSYFVATKKNEVKFQQAPNSIEKSTNTEQRF